MNGIYRRKFCFKDYIDFYDSYEHNNHKLKTFKVNFISDTFDDFVDDLLTSDIDLLKGELDLLIMQYLFQSINLESLNNGFEENDTLAA